MGWGASGGMGGVPRHGHMYVHARTCMKPEDKHVRKLQMAATMEAAMFIMFKHACMCLRTCVHVCVCMCMHACAWGVHHPTQPSPTHPHTPQSGTPQISKNAIRLEQIEIF